MNLCLNFGALRREHWCRCRCVHFLNHGWETPWELADMHLSGVCLSSNMILQYQKVNKAISLPFFFNWLLSLKLTIVTHKSKDYACFAWFLALYVNLCSIYNRGCQNVLHHIKPKWDLHHTSFQSIIASAWNTLVLLSTGLILRWQINFGTTAVNCNCRRMKLPTKRGSCKVIS